MRKKLEPVRKMLSEAVRLDADSYAAHCQLGLIDMQLGDTDEATQHLQAAMDISPELYTPYWYLARIAQGEKKYAKAEELYKKAIQKAPDNDAIKYDLSFLLVESGQLDKSEHLLQKIIKTYPKWSVPYNNLSTVYFRRNDKTNALKFLLKAYHLNPTSEDILYRLAYGYCHEFQINYKEAEEYYRKLIKIAPKNYVYRRQFAECLLLDNKKDKAKQQAETAIRLGAPPGDSLFTKLGINKKSTQGNTS